MNKAALKVVALTTLFFGFWGPLVGGLPYVWLVVTVPLAYVFGGVPALVCGLLYGLWELHSPTDEVGPWWCAARGALCGTIGSLVFGFSIERSSAGLGMAGLLALHGAPAGAILAAWLRGRRHRPAAPAQTVPAAAA